jgi:16S rRNA (uracil1498-N3)-methyltransferase
MICRWMKVMNHRFKLTAGNPQLYKLSVQAGSFFLKVGKSASPEIGKTERSVTLLILSSGLPDFPTFRLPDFPSFQLFLQMQLPFFFTELIAETGASLILNEETSKHAVSVLRMKQGEQLHLTDGKGTVLTVEIVNEHKKRCEVIVKTVGHQPQTANMVTVAISLLKNASRFEWFLEKATEIGVSEIVPLLCDRTERQHFRKNRMEGVLISAMLQSRQSRLPVLHEPVKYSDYINSVSNKTGLERLIAHCDESDTKGNLSTIKSSNYSTILIGPEGDFTAAEIQSARDHNFIPVSLGDTRLRTETAGVVAAALLKFR